ncbi:MAG: hypothetical protein R3Y64_11000, partial [Peptostreptococcaceae bacterium]
SYRRYEDPVILLKAMVCAKQFYALKEVVYRYRVGYKQVEWNEEKVIDLASSISEILKITSENNLEYLHALTVHRVDFERADVFAKILEQGSTGLLEILKKLNSYINIDLLNKYDNSTKFTEPYVIKVSQRYS